MFRKFFFLIQEIKKEVFLFVFFASLYDLKIGKKEFISSPSSLFFPEIGQFFYFVTHYLLKG